MLHSLRSAGSALLCVVLVWVATGQAPAAAAEFDLRGYQFTLPDGFTLELVAEPPLVTYPICASFDDHGHLYVAEASGVEVWQEAQPAEKPEAWHCVLRLTDSNGDGRFDQRTEFARFDRPPQGSLWLAGSLYVASPPVIWKLTDTTGDGIADLREKWVEHQEVTGCLNDLHGPYLGPDGWLYWTKGAGATQTYQDRGREWSTTARHILRRHPDRSDTEQVMVGGMDNPVEVAFARTGERFLSCTLMQYLGQPRTDGLLHAVYGGVYPKDIAPVFEFPWTGPELMPPMAAWQALSPAGLMRYESTALGRDFRDNLFSVTFSGHKVTRHILQADGATFACQDEDFLVCDDVQFHPTDVLEDADGSLLVIETGGWYRHCCPSSTFYRPDVQGAIYRIRRADAPPLQDPRGLRIDFAAQSPEQLAYLLGDPRPAVRDRAVHALGQLGAAAVAALERLNNRRSPADIRCQAVWAATRIDTPEARELVRKLLDDRDETVRHAAVSSVSLHRDALAARRLCELVEIDRSPAVRRAAAEALGRIGDSPSVSLLLDALAEPVDRFLEHSLIFALIEIADVPGTRIGLTSSDDCVRRAAMIALDQMPDGRLDPELVVAALDSEDARMRETGWWLVARRPLEYAPLLNTTLQNQLEGDLSAEERRTLIERLAGIARVPRISEWLADELTSDRLPAETRRLLVEAMGEAGGQWAEPRWVVAIDQLLTATNDLELLAVCVTALDGFPPLHSRDAQVGRPLVGRLSKIASRSDLPDDLRLRALSAIPQRSIGNVDDDLLSFLLSQLAADVPLAQRSGAAQLVTRLRLPARQLSLVAAAIGPLAPAELERVLSVFETVEDEALGLQLVAELETSSGLRGLHPSRLKSSLAAFGPAVQQRLQPLIEQLASAHQEQLDRAENILARLPEADPHRGLQVFSSKQAGCTACHQAANVGGTIGPHLRGIGSRRTARDLIESILFPSASMVQGFEPYTLITTDGRVFTGVIQKETPEELVITAGPDKTYRISRSSIDELVRTDISIMPAGLEKHLSDQQLADLIGYLQSLK